MEIDYYERANGECPVREFIESLQAKDRVLVMSKIEMLAEHGLNLDRPHSGTVRDKIRELRIKTRHGQHRILHFIFHRDTAVLLHGITKKSRKVPDPAIKKAIEYMQDYIATHPEE